MSAGHVESQLEPALRDQQAHVRVVQSPQLGRRRHAPVHQVRPSPHHVYQQAQLRVQQLEHPLVVEVLVPEALPQLVVVADGPAEGGRVEIALVAHPLVGHALGLLQDEAQLAHCVRTEVLQESEGVLLEVVEVGEQLLFGEALAEGQLGLEAGESGVRLVGLEQLLDRVVQPLVQGLVLVLLRQELVEVLLLEQLDQVGLAGVVGLNGLVGTAALQGRQKFEVGPNVWHQPHSQAERAQRQVEAHDHNRLCQLRLAEQSFPQDVVEDRLLLEGPGPLAQHLDEVGHGLELGGGAGQPLEPIFGPADAVVLLGEPAEEVVAVLAAGGEEGQVEFVDLGEGGVLVEHMEVEFGGEDEEPGEPDEDLLRVGYLSPVDLEYLLQLQQQPLGGHSAHRVRLGVLLLRQVLAVVAYVRQLLVGEVDRSLGLLETEAQLARQPSVGLLRRAVGTAEQRPAEELLRATADPGLCILEQQFAQGRERGGQLVEGFGRELGREQGGQLLQQSLQLRLVHPIAERNQFQSHSFESNPPPRSTRYSPRSPRTARPNYTGLVSCLPRVAPTSPPSRYAQPVTVLTTLSRGVLNSHLASYSLNRTAAPSRWLQWKAHFILTNFVRAVRGSRLWNSSSWLLSPANTNYLLLLRQATYTPLVRARSQTLSSPLDFTTSIPNSWPWHSYSTIYPLLSKSASPVSRSRAPARQRAANSPTEWPTSTSQGVVSNCSN